MVLGVPLNTPPGVTVPPPPTPPKGRAVGVASPGVRVELIRGLRDGVALGVPVLISPGDAVPPPSITGEEGDTVLEAVEVKAGGESEGVEERVLPPSTPRRLGEPLAVRAPLLLAPPVAVAPWGGARDTVPPPFMVAETV